MKYQIRHVTHYCYTEAVANSQHELHLWPTNSPRQKCESYVLEITPTPSARKDRLDYFGNHATHLVLSAPHRELQVVATGQVTVSTAGFIEADGDPPWDEVLPTIAKDIRNLRIHEMTFPSPFIVPWRDSIEYALPSFPTGRPLLAGCMDLMARMHTDFTYDPRATTIATPLPEVLTQRRGVCQDFAHLMIACLRGLGLSALYVSGYLVTTPPPGQPRLVGADASHAWLSVYSPRWGWVDLDPTNNCLVGEKHITLAIGRDFGDVTPMRGVILGGGNHELSVGVDVVPVD